MTGPRLRWKVEQMDTAQSVPEPIQRTVALGALSVAMGLIACAGVTVVWLLSGTASFDLPGWLRILSGWAFPIGALAALGFGVAARLGHSGPRLSVAGFVLAGLSVIEFGVMILSNPY